VSREIQIREFAMMEFCRFVVGVGCFLFILKQASPDTFSFYVKSGLPSILTSIPTDALIPAGIFKFPSAVALILTAGANAQIFTSIVQLIMIYMIHFFIFTWFHYFAVHRDLISTVLPIGNQSLFFCCSARPVELGKPVEVIYVNECVSPSRKWNQAVRFIQRLSNRVASNGKPLAHSGHKSSVKGFLLLNRNFITGGALCHG